MNVHYTRNSLQIAIREAKLRGETIGFVPTMGALHEGHLSLVRTAFEQTDTVVVSIFVNPTQFNNPTDLAHYPRMLDEDMTLLNALGNVLIFAPTTAEIYPENDPFKTIDLEGMDAVLEGEFRPGHFKGVVHVVYNLFKIVDPDKAFFGRKDFQQVAIIQKMVEVLDLVVEIVPCETTRSESGLALSSRNLRLSNDELEAALIIFQTLQFIRSLQPHKTPKEAQQAAVDFFNKGALKLEYLAIVDSQSLKELTDEWSVEATCCIAAHCGEVRLIDNMQF
jgi:pantoate--beta-alanine ligase